MRTLLLCLISIALLNGCATNPVTGKSQLSLLSPKSEIAMGKQQYQPSIQQQGGSYYIDPKVNAYVRHIGQTLARLSHQPSLPYEFTVINSAVPNAWALPGGKIAINTGLLLMLEDEAQLAAVLGHEIVHVTARHSAQSYSKNILLQTSVSLAGMAAGDLGGLVMDGIRMGGGAVIAKYGRDHELEADYYGTHYISKAGYDPKASVELQEKLMALSKGKAQGGLSVLFASHPPSSERIKKNLQTSTKLPVGKRNKQHFQQQMATLLKDADAYKHYNKAVKSRQEKDFKNALTEVNQAISKQNKAASFWEMKGDLLWQQGNKKTALSAYNKAVKYNPNFFQHHLARGLLLLDLKQFKDAKRDFTVANKILPTRMGLFYLGESDYHNGSQTPARKYYEHLSNGNDIWGKMSRKRLATIKP